MRLLIAKCPHCGRSVEATSDKLHEPVDCPHCRGPFEIEVPKVRVAEVRDVAEEESPPSRRVTETSERVLIKTHPAIFRGRPLRFVACLVLIALGGAGVFYGWTSANSLLLWGGAAAVAAGLFILAGWWLAALATTLTVTESRTVLRKGIFSRTTSEVEHDDIRNLQLDQSMMERLFGVGDIGISSSGQDDLEIVARAIPRPQNVLHVIRENQT
jgi:hypothetical protein